MDWEKIGEFIAKLRKENNWTQEQLADKLISTRHNISKWERGINTPSIEVLMQLGAIFNISINEILACQRRTKYNSNKIDNISLEIMKDNKVKLNRIVKFFILIIILMIIIFLFYYFINTYNTIYVYKIAGENDNFSSLDGIAIFSKNKNYLKIGTLTSKNDLEYYEYELFFYDNRGNENVILKSENNNDTLISFYEDKQNFSYQNMNYIIKNTYIKILYKDGEDIFKLNFQRDMVNNFLIPKPSKNISKNNIFEEKKNQFSGEILKNAENYFKNNFVYKREDDSYNFNGKIKDFNYSVKYSYATKRLEINEYRSEMYIYEFDFNFNDLKCSKYISNKDSIEELFVYSVEKQKCVSGKCNNVQIDEFFKNYYNVYTK